MATDFLSTGGFRAPDILGAVGTFTLEEVDPPGRRSPASFSAYMTKAAIPVAGYGGWSRVARPHKKALTEWVGRDSMSLQIEFLADAYAEADLVQPGMFIEDQIRDLERMAGIDINDPEPPLCSITSNPPKLIPHNEYRASHVNWFVDQLTWDPESVISNHAGNRVRAGGTLVITQYVADERLESLSSVKKRKKKTTKKGGRRKTYVVKAGDTLSTIAARKDVYGDHTKWKRIAQANHIRDPKKLKVGQHLIIP